MKDSIIIVGGGELTKPAYRIAQELGLYIIGIDQNYYAPALEYADLMVQASTKDIKLVLTEVSKIQGWNIKGVFTCGADVEVTVAAIAELLHLPGISLNVAHRCNNKHMMHKHLDKNRKTKKAKYALPFGLVELKKKIKSDFTFPCVIKPINNCGSRGITIIESESEIEDAYNSAVNASIRVPNINSDSIPVLVEEYLDGTKHTVEMITDGKEWKLLSIIDTHYLSKKYPCETGLNTTLLDEELQEEGFNFSVDIARQVGVCYGAHKVDVNIAEGGVIKLIELTARLSGGYHCQYVSPLAYGSNDIRAALKMAIGYPLSDILDDIKHRWNRGAAVRCVFPEPGYVSNILNIKKVKKLEGIKEVFVTCKMGDKVGPYLNSADRVCHIIADGETTEKAIKNAECGVSKTIIETRNN